VSGTGAAVFFEGASNSVTNSGTISITGVGGVSNNAAVAAFGGHNVIVNNAGGLITDFHAFNTGNAAIALDGGSNTVTNDGKIVGSVQLGTTTVANTYDGSDGRLKGTVAGGSGDDTILLGKGHSVVIGGLGADAISVGSGADTMVYTAAADSDITHYDSVDGFVAGTDTFSFALTGHHALTGGLSAVTVSSLSAVSDSAIEAAVSGHLDPYGAVALSVTSGLYSGDVFLVVDANGDSHFDTAPNDDYLVVLTHLSGTLSASDITTT
jgi:Ca2+-binding RTX toxin-like protein